mmetsp:Transcript_19988/g.38112  ORF Transcript_19988/g.38112 Transcript_19988/m.38112 type:complete len:209 (+) Transcript_19988:504-1130(+)
MLTGLCGVQFVKSRRCNECHPAQGQEVEPYWGRGQGSPLGGRRRRNLRGRGEHGPHEAGGDDDGAQVGVQHVEAQPARQEQRHRAIAQQRHALQEPNRGAHEGGGDGDADLPEQGGGQRAEEGPGAVLLRHAEGKQVRQRRGPQQGGNGRPLRQGAEQPGGGGLATKRGGQHRPLLPRHVLRGVLPTARTLLDDTQPMCVSQVACLHC